jgi:phytoene dehydrogenase-like protein
LNKIKELLHHHPSAVQDLILKSRVRSSFDAVVVGSGPNGLAAAITLAQKGLAVMVYEANSTLGGGARTQELTLPGFKHDVCSAVHPLGASSPFFRSLPLQKHGLEWIDPPGALAHPLDDGTAILMGHSIEETAARLKPDSRAYESLMTPFVRHWEAILHDVLSPLRLPRSPVLFARFGVNAIQSARTLAKSRFKGERAKALFAGIAAHSGLPLQASGSAGFGLVLSIPAHTVGWPIVRGGSQNLTQALAGYFHSLGGRIQLGTPIRSLKDLPSAKLVLFDLTPHQILKILGLQLPATNRVRFKRYQYGPAVFKMDWALSGPIPWIAPECKKSATIHLGGSFEEIVSSEETVSKQGHPKKPFIILAQPTLFDPTRAPLGKHIAWAYCHVPLRSTEDMSSRIEDQIERFAPGFRNLILARKITTSEDLEKGNENHVGGDIGGGSATLSQLLFRPILQINPYRLPLKGFYICSSSTPPGAAVHGMCGFQAATSALKNWKNL